MGRALKYRWRGLFCAIATLAGLACVQAADPAANEEVIARYEQILEREPVEGPSLDKLLQIYQDGEGLEKLDAHWAPLSAQAGAKGATYSLLRGLLADRMAKTDEARKLLQAATQVAPDDYHEWMALGDFEVRQGKWADAIAALQKGLATQVTGDDRLSLYRKLGQAQERNLDTAAALATWQKMVGEFPKDSFALEEAGTAELDAEQFDEAKKTFQKLVDLTEENSMNRVQALMRLAEVDDRQGKTDDAVHDYEAILPLTAEASWLNRELRAQIEQVYRREDDLAGLVTYYQKWTTDNPKDVEALLLLAGTLNELGKKPEALDVLRKVTVLAPDRHEVRESFAQALFDAKQYDEAITVLTALTADDPTEPRYWETMGDALLAKTQPPTPESTKAALDAWAHIAPADTKDVAAVLEVADLCGEHGLNDEALAGYNRALGLTPDASDIREKAVKLLVELKRTDEAWKLLDAMTDGPLATAANYLKLATLDLQFERKDAAAAAIQKGLALEPGNFDLLSHQWSLFAEAQKWTDCIALFDKLVAAAPNAYFIDQLEARQVQALTSAGQLDATEKALRANLGADPGLTEGELRMLLRILVQQSDPDVPKVLDEAHRRFPQSVSLIRIEIDYNRHAGNDDAAVAALQRLIETQPNQKADWLTEMVHVRQDEGNLDEALKAAQQIIDASPTSADGYLLYAEIAFNANKADDAVAKLQAAIKVSDKANDIRQRLARHYLESGQAGKARTVYDEAFAAADNPQDKLAIVRAMTAAYFQDGQIEELINRFKKEQNSEEGGWRYGLYLSAIDEQMEDFGAARRELAKSLAVRPNDTGLLHSLIGLADKEGDLTELLRYREMLAKADPSATNELALANEYAEQDRPANAWRIVQKEQAEVVKDPLAWKDVLNQISDPDYAAKIKAVLQEAIRAKGDSFEGKFALVQFLMQQGDLAGAKSTLWEILAQPLPVAPPVQPANPKPLAASVFGYGFYQGPLFQRTSQSYTTINEAQQLLAAAQNGNNMMRQRMGFGRMRGMSMFGQGVTTTLAPATIKDHSLIYLSVIALQEKHADELLKEFEAKFEEWHWSLSERIVAYSLIQAREPLLAAIEEQAKSTNPDKDLDGFCFMACEGYLAQPHGQVPDDAMRKRAEAAQDILSGRLGTDPQFKSMVAMMKINELAADQSTEAAAKKKAAMADYLKTVDRKNPDELISAIGIASQVGSWDEIKKAVNDLAATDRTKWSITTTQQLAFLPMSILNQTTLAKGVTAKDTIPVVLQLIRLSYPAIPPQPALTPSSPFGQVYYGGVGFYNQNFPPPNRYFGPDRIGALEPMFQQLKARTMLPDMYAALDAEEKSLTDWRRIYPELLRVYFQWWDGKRDDSIASVKKLMEQDSSDDFKQLLAAMLTQEQKYDEAIPVLDSISARYGPDYIHTQMQLLHVARLAKNNDAGQKAGLRLLALRLPQQEQMQILDDLRAVGLKDKADAIMAKQSSGGFNQGIQTSNSLIQSLNTAANNGDETVAVDIAHQILNQDPLVQGQYGNENYQRIQALQVLKRYLRIEDYVQDIEKQLQATPDSIRLNWLAAEAYQNMDAHVDRTLGLAPLPQWLKLQRTGNTLEGFYSLDGTAWNSAGKITLPLPGKLYLGFWQTTERSGPPAQSTFDQIVFTGKMSAADQAPPSSLAPDANTNLPSSMTPEPVLTNAAPVPPAAPGPLAAPWQQCDIGPVMQPGSVQTDPSGAMTLIGALGGKPPTGVGTHFIYQMLDGDGTMVARLTRIKGMEDGRLDAVGLMIREFLAPGSRAAAIALNQTRDLEWRSRKDPSNGSDGKLTPDQPASTPTAPRESDNWYPRIGGEFTTPIWLKLSRKGNIFTGSTSLDGKFWSDIFSHTIVMGPDMRAGLMSAVSGQMNGQAAWSDIKVNGVEAQPPLAPAQPTPPATPLGPPWDLIDIGGPAQHGSAEWSGSILRLSSSVPLMSGDSRSYSLVYQTLHGDGEIVAHLESQRESGYRSYDGLAIRSRLDKDAPEIEFYRVNANQIAYYLSTDTAEPALKYYRRVAELDPKNQAVLMQIANQFQQAKRPGDAVDIYTAILKADFSTGMSQYGSMMQSFEDANRLPDFLKIIDDWMPPPHNPMGGGGQDMYFVLIQVGNQVRQAQHLPEAERVYRKALTVDTFQSKQDGVAALAQVLMDQNRRDDAATEIEKWLLDQGAPKLSLPPPPILGFNFQTQPQNNWFQSMSWNQNGMVSSPMMHFLELAVDLGLAPKLEQELKARADKKAPSSVGLIDQDRLTCIVLAILARDPAYKVDLEKLLKENPASSANFSNNSNAFLILAQELEKWQQERSMALRVATFVYAGKDTNSNNFFQNIAGLQVLRIAQEMGDHKTAQTTLRSLADSIRQARAVNGNQVQMEQALTIIHQMVQEGMLKEATDMLTDAKTDPQLANGNTYYQQKIDQAQKELDFAKGGVEAASLVYGLAPATEGKSRDGGTIFFWELSAEKGQNTQSFQSEVDWSDGAPVTSTTYRIEVNGGPDMEHVTTKIASYDDVNVRGSAPIKIPPGTQALEAVLIRTKQPPFQPPTTPAPIPSIIDTGHIIPIGGSENLLKNPDFKETKDATGKTEIVGWHGILAANVSQETGGPLPSGIEQAIEINNGSFGMGSEIVSDRIAIQPGTNYVLNAWVRSSISLGWRCLDADGKELDTRNFSGSRNETRWWWGTFTLGEHTGRRIGGESIPPKTAFIEIVLRPNQNFNIAGLSFRVWPTTVTPPPVPTAPIPAPPAPAH